MFDTCLIFQFLVTTEDVDENSDDDPDDRDVTDKYLTSHYRKDVTTPTMV